MTLLGSSLLLGLVWFAVANAVASTLAWLLARRLLREDSLDSSIRSSSRFLVVRLMPSLASVIFVCAVFLPVHVRYEPDRADESLGVVLGALVALSLGLITRSVIRAGRVFLAGWRVGTLVRRVARPVADGALALDGFAGVSLAGILRPKILIGTTAMECLTRAELDVAIAHEVAHRRSNDNLKRLVLHCVPDFFGWTAAARELEARWEAEVECEADASAVAGDDRRAVLLASALVKVSRQRRVPSLLPASPAWSAFHEPSILETRVRRLVNGITPMASWERLWPAATLALALSSALLFGRSHTLHLVTEAMVAYLP